MQKRYLADSNISGNIDEVQKDEIIQGKIIDSIEEYWKPSLYDGQQYDRSNNSLLQMLVM